MPREPIHRRVPPQISPWPPEPYLGLNYFRASDRALLTGRDADIADCSELLTHPQTRVLLLHGSTGCGKSSFLRAGLIPALDEHGPMYLFLRQPTSDGEALFIRCSAAPVDQIARQVFLFAKQPFFLRTPAGERTIDLSSALLGCPSWEDYLSRAREDFGEMSGLACSLRWITEAIPQTLVLIVDQAEEVLTLNPGAEDYHNRAAFFGFLREVQRLAFDARILVALRTEYLGRFLDAIQISYRNESTFCYFLLNELAPQSLREAVLRPTLKEEVPPWGIPYDAYGFTIEPGLAHRIVQDVLQARYSGPALPVLQLVCLGLYRSLAGRSEITDADYNATGGTEGQVVAHIEQALGWTSIDQARHAATRAILQEYLAEFYIMQDDGTVVARTRSAAWAHEQLTKHMPSASADELIDRLTAPQTLVLRRLRNVTPDGRIAEEITLGHDTIALAVERWRSLDAEEQAKARSRQEARASAIGIALYGALVLFCVAAALVSPSFRGELFELPVSAYSFVIEKTHRYLPIFVEYQVLYFLTKIIAGILSFLFLATIFVTLPASALMAIVNSVFDSRRKIRSVWQRLAADLKKQKPDPESTVTS